MYKNWTDAQREQTSEPLLVKLLKKQVLVPPPPQIHFQAQLAQKICPIPGEP